MITNTSFVEKVCKKKNFSQKWYVRLLRVLNIIFPCKFPDSNKTKRNYTYLTISRKSHLDMVAASLYSLYKNSANLPQKIVIISDGSWTPDYGINYFKKRNLAVECKSWSECADFYKERLPELSTWAYKHIWGKKMAAILYESESSNVLFSDPDVLWYSSPLRDDEWDNTPLKVCIDCCHSYDQEYINTSNFHELNETDEPVNCGIVYISGGHKLLNEHAKHCVAYQAEHCGNFAEQTVFAIMDLQFKNRWNEREVICSIDDIINPFFSDPILYESTIARHYLWRLKWIYWTEYFKMRLKK